MRYIFKQFLVVALFFMFCLGVSFSGDAQGVQSSGENLQEGVATGSLGTGKNGTGERVEEAQNCTEEKYVMKGKKRLKKGVSAEFAVNLKEDIKSDFLEDIEYQLYKNKNTEKEDEAFELVEAYTGEVFSYSFPDKGEYKLKVTVSEENGCDYEFEKNIYVYEDVILYVGKEFQNSLQMNTSELGVTPYQIYMKKVVLEETSFFSQNELLNKLSNSVYYLRHSDKVVLNIQGSKLGSVFEVLGSISDLYNLEVGVKNLYVITDINKNFLNRILAKYTKIIGAEKIFVVEEDDFFDFLSSQGRKAGEEYKDVFSLSLEDTPKYLFLSYVMDLLIYNGFPTDLLVLMLTLAVSALLISFFRQVIGFSVFGVYNPLLFAVSILVLGTKFSFVLLFISFISTLFIRAFTKKIYLLHSAKISLLIIIYFLVTIFVLGMNNILGVNFIDYGIFSNSFIIFPIIAVILIANKVFHEGFSLFSIGWWFHFIEFLVVTFSIYFLISWSSFQNLLLSYPEIIFVVIFVNILIGRFTGLQLLEYFRFMPLIKKQFEEE